MFGHSFFGAKYYGPTYFGPAGDGAVVVAATPSGAFTKNVLNPFEVGFDDGGTDFHKSRPQIEKKTLARLKEEERLADLESAQERKIEALEIQIEQKQRLPDNRAARRAIASLEAQHHRTLARLSEIQAELVRIRALHIREEEDEDDALMLLLAYH
jgi:hypothetical protein